MSSWNAMLSSYPGVGRGGWEERAPVPSITQDEAAPRSAWVRSNVGPRPYWEHSVSPLSVLGWGLKQRKEAEGNNNQGVLFHVTGGCVCVETKWGVKTGAKEGQDLRERSLWNLMTTAKMERDSQCQEHSVWQLNGPWTNHLWSDVAELGEESVLSSNCGRACPEPSVWSSVRVLFQLLCSGQECDPSLWVGGSYTHSQWNGLPTRRIVLWYLVLTDRQQTHTVPVKAHQAADVEIDFDTGDPYRREERLLLRWFFTIHC